MRSDDLSVLFEDNHLLGVVKPVGLLVQGDRTGDVTLLALAKAYLKRKYAKPGNVFLGLVHRLDRPVSGVVLLARTSKAASRLAEQFRTGAVTKIYWAVVNGCPEREKDELTAYLSPRPDDQGRTLARTLPFPGAREARLAYRILDRVADRTLLELRPQTGRRHQLRAQLGLLGIPILGDVKYGAFRRLADRSIALLARELTVAHPVGGRPVSLTAEPPHGWPWPPVGRS